MLYSYGLKYLSRLVNHSMEHLEHTLCIFPYCGRVTLKYKKQ